MDQAVGTHCISPSDKQKSGEGLGSSVYSVKIE
jgi:hypothetical protein